MAVIFLFIAYILPLPILAACLYYHLYDTMDVTSRLLAIGATSLAPSALLMIFALKRILHTVFHVLIFGALLYGLYRFGLIGQHPAAQ